MMGRSLLVLLLVLPINTFAQNAVTIWTADNGWTTDPIVFLRQGDSLAMAIPAGSCLLELRPTDSSYHNLPEFAVITYSHQVLATGPDTLKTKAIDLGISYFAVWPSDQSPPALYSGNPPSQIRVRRDDNYLGYLTELIGVPFLLPPRRFADGRHQTDLGLGVDCAELAIYGRRRLGFDVPYVGPGRISDYLMPIPSDSLFEGCIIHFGGQVSVLYKDFERKGQLDPEDLLIQSFETFVRTVPFRNSGWVEYPWQAFTWR